MVQLVDRAQTKLGGTALMHVLLDLSARALDLPPSHFAPFYTTPGCNMRLAYYPPGNAVAGDENLTRQIGAFVVGDVLLRPRRTTA